MIDARLIPELLDQTAVKEASKIFFWAVETRHEEALRKYEALLPAWLSTRKEGLRQLSHCLKQECLPVDVWREGKQAALLLDLINHSGSPAIKEFAPDNGALVKGVLGQLIASETDLRLPVVLKIEFSRPLLEWADYQGDRTLVKVVVEQILKVLPSIAGSVKGRGFDKKSAVGELIGSQLAALDIYITLYQSTAELSWLERAQQIAKTLMSELLGLEGKVLRWKKGFAQPATEFAPLLLSLFHYTGAEDYRSTAAAIVAQAAGDISELDSGQAADILRAVDRISGAPLHITVVGRKSDPDAIELFDTARKFRHPFKRLEWWDQGEGKMLNPDVRFPSLKRSAAFICIQRRCSMPIFNPGDIARTIEEFTGSGK